VIFVETGGGTPVLNATVVQLLASAFALTEVAPGTARIDPAFGTDTGEFSEGDHMHAGSLVATPASASSSGNAGDWSYDSGFIYVCVNTDTWVRAVLTTWI
jgi:hypothetical protein